MNTNPALTNAYYSIIQYIPDIERSEAANIGVVLFSPDGGGLYAKLDESNERVLRFFGADKDIDLDVRRLTAIKIAFQERIAFEGSRIATVEGFRQFIGSRGNNMLLTEARSIKVVDREEELEYLFKRLVLIETRPLNAVHQSP
jgi:hypothetical protein